MYVSVSDWTHVNDGWLANSSVVHFDRDGRLVERFVTGDEWHWSELGSITAHGDALYAFDWANSAVFVWCSRQPPHAQPPVGATADGEGKEAAGQEGQQGRREAVDWEPLLRALGG